MKSWDSVRLELMPLPSYGRAPNPSTVLYMLIMGMRMSMSTKLYRSTMRRWGAHPGSFRYAKSCCNRVSTISPQGTKQLQMMTTDFQ